MLTDHISASGKDQDKEVAPLIPAGLCCHVKLLMLRINFMRVFLCAIFLFLMAGAPLFADDEAQRLVALVDYIGGDYRNAVQGGKVTHNQEYQEMREFSARSLELLDQLKSTEQGDKAGIESSLRALASHIEKKENARLVSELARRIKEKLIAAYKIAPHPKRMPSFLVGRTVFLQNCAQCHGETGKGDGSARETMNPKVPVPANFTDPQLMAGLSPFRAFNAITFGVEKTAMADFSALSEEERWQAAFYLFSLRFSGTAAADGKKVFEAKRLPDDLKSPATLATLSDEELLERFKLFLTAPAEAFNVLAYLRRGLLEEQTADPLIAARLFLQEAMKLYEKGEREKAYEKAVDAYLEGFELAEPALFAKDASFGRAVESQLAQFRSSLKRGDSLKELQGLYQEIDAGLVQASELLSGGDTWNARYAFSNAFVIIVREGLEAALILAAILALLRMMGAVEAIRYIHLGWILALVSGLLTWILAQTVLTFSGSHRESMEGATTVLAAIILFYVGYWLHTKAEARKWQRFIHDKVEGALSSRRILALVGVSFFAVYREAFEVVLFYQALWLQSPSTHQPVVWGFLAGAAVLGLIVFALLRLGLKIPMKYFFGAAGALLYLLAFVFMGQGVKELQTAGWFSVTPLRFPPPVGPLGVYPTVETLTAQGLMLLALLATLAWMARQRQKYPAE